MVFLYSLICLTVFLVTAFLKIAIDEEIAKILFFSISVFFLFLSFLFASGVIKVAIALILVLDRLLANSLLLGKFSYLYHH